MSVDSNSVFTALKSKRERVKYKAGDVIYGVYRPNKWEKCTVSEYTDEGYTVWFHVDPMNEYRDIRRSEASWAIAKLTKSQIDASNTPLSPSSSVNDSGTSVPTNVKHSIFPDTEESYWYPCWILDDEDFPDKWHVHLWYDIDSRRSRTFLLPHSCIETGNQSARPINSSSFLNKLCCCAIL